ncbi:aldo/keto reductase [Burkholderia sp. AU4i]|uniref:aldo/keto reductase n=1 Tax=Burkholderia TaxID=32008 RepID=UPI000398C10F|nr:aldo/keto reductase [Burkholderia sp. AU4i]KVE81601.1 hypothetical protein WI99_23410 [Burkholderia cepacia]
MPRDNLADLPAFIAVARERSFTRAAGRCATSVAFALAWVMKNRIVGSTIAGLRTDAHRDSDIAMLTPEPGPDDERFVDRAAGARIDARVYRSRLSGRRPQGLKSERDERDAGLPCPA